jgi:DNA topoisomerase-1
MLEEFYTPFHATIEEKEKTIKKADVIARPLGVDPTTKLPVQALLGRFGPYVKIGEVETPIKEALTASIPEDMSFETITLEQAIEVIKISEKQAENNVLGDHPELGHPILALTGRFGPYIKLDDPDAKKPKMVSIVPPFALETITLEDALQLLTLPRQLGEEDGVMIQANNGRYGPYVQKAKEYRSIPNDGTLFTITLEAASKLLKEPKPKRGKGGKAAAPGKVLGQDKKGKDISLKSGRYGAYVTDGKTNASLPKSQDAEKLTIEDAIKLIEAKKKK